MNLQDVYKKIAEDINYLFANMANTLKFDKTFRAKVIDTMSNGKYKVLYKNKEYTAKCDGKVNVDDMVWVCAPGNDWNELYVQSITERLEKNTTLYVATTGSDTIGDGTSGNPFKTIQFAINTLPKDLGGYTASIVVADGTYDGVEIRGFYSGFLNFRGSEKSIDNLLCNINGGFEVAYCNCVVSVKYMNFLSTQFASMSVSHVSSFQAHFVSSTIAAQHPGVNLVGVPTFIIDQSKFSNRNIAVLAHDSYGWVAATSGNDNIVGIRSEYGSIVKLIGNGVFPEGGVKFESILGGTFIQPSGTQISGIISSGLSCTWATMSGGYIRHGNMAGTAMVTVQLNISITTALTAGVIYTISGFPVTPYSVAVTGSAQSAVGNCYIGSNGVLKFIPSININAGSNMTFGCTYLTNP